MSKGKPKHEPVIELPLDNVVAMQDQLPALEQWVVDETDPRVLKEFRDLSIGLIARARRPEITALFSPVFSAIQKRITTEKVRGRILGVPKFKVVSATSIASSVSADVDSVESGAYDGPMPTFAELAEHKLETPADLDAFKEEMVRCGRWKEEKGTLVVTRIGEREVHPSTREKNNRTMLEQWTQICKDLNHISVAVKAQDWKMWANSPGVRKVRATHRKDVRRQIAEDEEQKAQEAEQVAASGKNRARIRKEESLEATATTYQIGKAKVTVGHYTSVRGKEVYQVTAVEGKCDIKVGTASQFKHLPAVLREAIDPKQAVKLDPQRGVRLILEKYTPRQGDSQQAENREEKVA